MHRNLISGLSSMHFLTATPFQAKSAAPRRQTFAWCAMDLHPTTSCNWLVTHRVLIKRNGFVSIELEVCSGSRNVGVRMNQFIDLLETHGYWVLFASVAGRQACLPVPANLLLLAAGALARQGKLNPVAILACSVAAFILEDLAWHEAGRRWGTKTLHFF
jgi:hypothetical protein